MGADVFHVFTREEAIEEFREMWNWMAEETEDDGRDKSTE